MNQIALFPLKSSTLQSKILSISNLDNKYYTAPVAFTQLNSISDLTCDFQVVILDDLHLLPLVSNDSTTTVFFIGHTTDDPAIFIDPSDPDAFSQLKAELDLIDWPEKHVKSLEGAKIEIFEQLLQFKRGDNIEEFLNLLKQLE